MPPSQKFPLRTFMLMTTLPVIGIGALLWYLAGLVPGCAVDETARLTSPDGQYDLVTFTRSCGEANRSGSQAVLVPAGDSIPDDAASFVRFAAEHDLQPRWSENGNIELDFPEGAQALRQDPSVAGITVNYR